jgi:hypothetical protein
MPRPAPDDLLLSAFGPGASYANAFARRSADSYFSPTPDETDDLCSALPLTLTRGAVRVWCDPRTVSDATWGLLRELGVALGDREQVSALPEGLRSTLGSEAWCEAWITLLAAQSPARALRLAQPFVDARLEDRYRIPAELCRMVNDKAALPRLVPAAAPPPRLLALGSGAALAAHPWPGRCIVKVSGSCAGAGVFPCADAADWDRAVQRVATLPGEVVVERWIDVVRNLDVEFLVPADPSLPPQILGAVEQVVDASLKLCGGVCRPAWPAAALEVITRRLTDEILPALRALGWHGVGGFDVLVDRAGEVWFMDPNLRLTDFTAPLMRSLRCREGESLLILPYATFEGTLDDFRRVAAPLAREGTAEQELAVLGLLDDGERLVVQAGLLFRSPAELVARARRWQALGLRARALELAEPIAASEAVSGRPG